MGQSLRSLLGVALLCGLLGSGAPAVAQESPSSPPGSSSAVAALPAEAVPYALTPASPNPFTHRTTFRLHVAEAQHVRAEVYNMLGQRVTQLYDGILPAGTAHMLTFEADGLPSGIYIIRVQGKAFTASRQVTLLR